MQAKQVQVALKASLGDLFKRFVSDRARLRQDFGQAKFRLVISSGFLVYFLALYLGGFTASRDILILIAFTAFYAVASPILVVWTKKYPRAYLIRRLFTILADNSITTLTLILADQYAWPALFCISG
jgi:hypothetical protein